MPIVVSGASWADLPGVSLTADSEAVGLGVGALRTPVLGEVWRTGAGSTRNLRVDLGSQRSITAVVLQAPRDGLLPEATATVRLTLSTSSQNGTDAGDVTASLSMPRGYWCWVPAAAVNARYLRLQLTSTQPYLQFGRMWVAGGLRTTKNIAESGYEPGAVDETAQATRSQVQVTVPGLSEAEADLLEDIGLQAGTQRQVLVIPRTERGARTAIIGKFTAIPAPKVRQAWGGGQRLHTASLSIKEDR